MNATDFQRLKETLDGWAEQVRQDRIERGLPADPPADFVDIPLSIVIAGRLRPFLRIAVKYLAVLAEGTVYRVDTDKLAQYQEYAELLAKSIGSHCGAIGGNVKALLSIMNKLSAMEDVTEADIQRAVYYGSIYAKQAATDATYDVFPIEGDYLVRKRIVDERRAEVARLRADDSAFQAAYDEARVKYDEIKHLL